MFTALIVTAMLGCKPYRPPPPPPPVTVVRCEGADSVRRDAYGVEVDRWSKAPQCMTTRCEGADFVRRDSRGLELERWSAAPSCRVRLTTDQPIRFGLSTRG